MEIPTERDLSSQPDEIREQLLSAGRLVFMREGYARARMQDIAREAGVSTGAIYNRFRGKSELFAALLNTKPQDEIESEMSELPHTATLEEVLRNYAARITRGVPRTNDALMVEAFTGARADQDALTIAKERLETITARHEQVFSNAQREGLLPPRIDAGALAAAVSLIRVGSAVLNLTEVSTSATLPKALGALESLWQSSGD